MWCSLLHGSWDQILQRRPSVTPFWLCSHHHIIMKFSGVITNDKSDVQRSKVTEVMTHFSSFQTATPVWIHILRWNDAAWCCLGEVPYCFSRSSVKFQGHTAKTIVEFDPDWAFPDCNSSLNSPMATKWYTNIEVAWKRCPIVFQGHPSNLKVTRLWKSSNLTQIGHFQTVTPVWIHQWLRNDAQSSK